MVYDQLGRQALEISPDGKVAVRSVQVHLDGSVEVMEGRQVLRPKADEVAKGIADGTVLDIARPPSKSQIRTYPPIGFPPGYPPVIPGEPGGVLYEDNLKF